MKFNTPTRRMLVLILYSSLFGNSCHNGFINSSSQATGQIAWSKTIAVEAEGPAEARLLQSAEKMVIVEGIRQIFAFNQDGELLWQRPKWYDTPIVLKDEWIYYTSASRNDRMEAIDLTNRIQLEDVVIPEVGENAYIVLFEPIQNGIVAQVQYAGGNRPGKGPNYFAIYREQSDIMDYVWYKRYDGESPMIPLINMKKGFLLTMFENDALVFDINTKEEEPEPKGKFPYPVGEGTMWASSGDDGSLYWAGLEKGRTVLAVTDLKGEMKWRWESERRPQLKQDEPVAPPIITPDRAYLLSQKNLCAIKDGKLLWSFEAKDDNFTHGTALADNSVLVTAGKKLYRVGADGNSLFEVSVEEALVTPPVIDEDGNIYVASSETLYAIH